MALVGGEFLKAGILFSPASIEVVPGVRRLLRRVIWIEKYTLRFHGEDFGGFVAFRVPSRFFHSSDVLTICAELAQEDLGVRAAVETWRVQEIEEDLLAFTPDVFELQAEDREADPVSRKEFIDMVRPSEGWGR